jgi:hypothetical protein
MALIDFTLKDIWPLVKFDIVRLNDNVRSIIYVGITQIVDGFPTLINLDNLTDTTFIIWLQTI